MIQKEAESKKRENNSWLCIGKGLLISFMLTMILLFLFSILLTYTSIPSYTIGPVVIIISGLSILAGSSISMIHIPKKGILYGGLVGAFYVAGLYILSSFLENNFALSSIAVVFILVGIVTGSIGGIIGVNRK